MVSTRSPISKSSSPRINSLVIVSRAPITIGVTFIFIFRSFCNVLVLLFLFAFFQFFSVVNRDSKVHISASSLFLAGCGGLTDIRRSVCISKSQWSLCASFSMKNSGLCIYHLFVWSNFNFLHNSQQITLPT